MEQFLLVHPSPTWGKAIMSYRREFLDAGSSMDGCGSLRRCETAEEYLEHIAQYADPDTVPEGRVQSTQFLWVRKSDGVLVGMIQVRHRLNEALASWGGHIGYSIRPSERGKGYAVPMLAAVLPYCRSLGLEKVLVTCSTDNEPSRRTILSNGGVFDGTAVEPETGEVLERYWVPVPKGK